MLALIEPCAGCNALVAACTPVTRTGVIVVVGVTVGIGACCVVPVVAACANGAIGVVIPASTGINSAGVGCIPAIGAWIGCMV